MAGQGHVGAPSPGRGDGGTNARLDLIEYRLTQVEANVATALAKMGTNTSLLIGTLFTVIGGMVMLLINLVGGQ
jgi:tetrahydromethanopterin S-methyltransferase subunit G